MEIFNYGEILVRIVEGDEHAFAELVKREERRILGILRSQFPKLDYEAIFQEAMLKVWANASKVNTTNSDQVSGWIYRVAINTAYDEARKERNRIRLPDILSREVREDPLEDRVVNRLYAAAQISRLDHNDRGTVLMVEKYTLDMSDEGLAKAKGLPLGTVKSMISRSKERARLKLQSYEK